MKKLLLLGIVLMLMMTGCTKKEEKEEKKEETVEIPGDASQLFLVKVETEGIGLVAAAKEGEALEFDEQMTSSSAYMNVPAGTVLKIGAKDSVDDYKFVRWTKDGKDYSTDQEITVTIEAPTDFIAVFGLSTGWDGPSASVIDEVKTMGDVLGLPVYSCGVYDDALVYVFELEGTVYRAIVDLTPEVSASLKEAFGDDEKFNEIVAPLEIGLIDNVTEAMPTQKELDRYVRKTGGDLLDGGWSITYYDLDQMEFGMEYGWFTYKVKFDGKIEYSDDLDAEAAIRDLIVSSVICDGVGSGVSDLLE